MSTGPRRLRSGAPRVFRSHSGSRGGVYRRQFEALKEQFGPFNAFTQQFAAGVAKAYCTWLDDEHAVEDAQKARDTGMGRRPSAANIRSLKKRAALSWGSYSHALRQLEAMKVGRPLNIGEALQRLQP